MMLSIAALFASLAVLHAAVSALIFASCVVISLKLLEILAMAVLIAVLTAESL